MLVLPLVVFAGVFALQWRSASEERLPWPLWAMAAATTGAGAVHAAMTGHHARLAAPLGWAMAVFAVGQLGGVVWLLIRPVRRTVEVGVWGNLGVVVLWAWTRLVGLPFGVEGGQRERLGLWDGTSTLLEAAAVLAGLVWVSTQARVSATPSMRSRPGVVREARTTRVPERTAPKSLTVMTRL
jgi:hypothetical protein